MPETGQQTNAEPSISELLAAYGITHEPGEHMRRYLRFNGNCIGMASAQEAVSLLAALEAISPRKGGSDEG
jgi:hypothetical protein